MKGKRAQAGAHRSEVAAGGGEAGGWGHGGEICRELEASEPTYHRWRKRYGSVSEDQLKRLKALEKENARLKRIVANQAVDMSILKKRPRETSEPGPETTCGGARAEGGRSLRAPGVPSVGPAAIDAALSKARSAVKAFGERLPSCSTDSCHRMAEEHVRGL